MQIRKSSAEANIMLALTKWVRRNIGRAMNIEWIKAKLPIPSNPFRMKFALTSTIEPDIKLPIDRDRPATVCAVMGWQGPSPRKYPLHEEYAKQANEAIGEPWQNFMLKEIVDHARAQGIQAVALLRPEHNKSLTEEHFVKIGLDPKTLPSIRSQFYAAARKVGLKKVRGSKYFWIFFPKK